jgi:hypothetical protein
MNTWNTRWAKKGRGGTNALEGATVIANVLELVDDRYRGTTYSDIFAKQIKFGSINGVMKFQLVLLTVDCGEGLDIYGEDDVRATVDLNNKRLPDLLRPVFAHFREWPKSNNVSLSHQLLDTLVLSSW